MGDFEKGWEHYEWRYRFFSYMAAIYHLYWKGQNIENKTIYVHAEQGLGDTIQFIRYIKLLKKKKAKVVFCVQGELKELIKSFKGIDEIDFMPPAKIKTDSYHVCLLSLPFIFKTNLKNIPKEIPYLFAEKKESEKWKKTFSSLKGLKIGIVWKPSKISKTFEERYSWCGCAGCPVPRCASSGRRRNCSRPRRTSGWPWSRPTSWSTAR